MLYATMRIGNNCEYFLFQSDNGTSLCDSCGEIHNIVAVNDSTVIKEFHKNYYLDNKHDCFYAEEDRYCVLVEWAKFKSNPNFYIEQAFQKRSEPIANKVIVYPK